VGPPCVGHPFEPLPFYRVIPPSDPATLRLISKLHTLSARELNAQDQQPGRKVWVQYFDSHSTFTNSYLARLKYVHHNPAHHGLVACAQKYPWCSAGWFAQHARPAFRATVEGFKVDVLTVRDAFDPQSPATPEDESGVPDSRRSGPQSK